MTRTSLWQPFSMLLIFQMTAILFFIPSALSATTSEMESIFLISLHVVRYEGDHSDGNQYSFAYLFISCVYFVIKVKVCNDIWNSASRIIRCYLSFYLYTRQRHSLYLDKDITNTLSLVDKIVYLFNLIILNFSSVTFLFEQIFKYE